MPALHMRTHASVMSRAMATFSSGFKLPRRFASSFIFVNGYHSDKFSVSSHCSFGFEFLCLTEATIHVLGTGLDYNLTLQPKNKKG